MDNLRRRCLIGINEDLYSQFAVDLGLPSGVLWAKTNIDLSQPTGFALSEFQYECSFFSWGNTDGHNPISANSFGEYSWGNDNSASPYHNSDGDNLTGDIPLSQDAANVNLGTPWKMPTSAEIQELINNCDCIKADGSIITATNKLVTLNGIVGLNLRSKINGKILFLPASGLGYEQALNYRGSIGLYWSSTHKYEVNNDDNAYTLTFNSNIVNSSGYGTKFKGLTIRPVMYPLGIKPLGSVDKTGATVGSICISNGTEILFTSLESWQAYPGTEYRPIGVTVAAVGDCGDDLVRICSIPYMNYFKPDVGNLSYQNMYYNGRNISIGGGITETTNINTAKADYNGKANTAAILVQATSQPNWRTDSTITNSNSSSTNAYFPAACCCWRFSTLGTHQGDWYLPAVGELHLAYQNKTAIKASLNALGVTDAFTNNYWTSTIYDSTQAWRFNAYNDSPINANRNSAYRVCAFAAF